MGKKRRYIKELDGIRAIAVIMVLAYHLKLALFKSGFLGVTVFFVLSGYLITGILISEVEEEGTIDLKNFWLRRIRRLVPAVMSMAVVIIFVSAVVNRIIFTKGCKDFLASVLGFNNWWQIFNKISYFEAAGVPSPFTHCWSLAIETQFYLIYPLILLGIYKLVKSRGEGRANRGLLFAGVTLLLALISVILMIVLFDPQQDASRVYYGTDTRAFSLLFGALLSSDTFWSPQTTHYNLQLFQEKSTIASQRHDHASFPTFYQLNAWLLIAANITSASITFLSI
ncbi:MAG: acyltransferase [Enterocloster sp.]